MGQHKLRRLQTHFAFTILPWHSINEFIFRFALAPFLKFVFFDHKGESKSN